MVDMEAKVAIDLRDVREVCRVLRVSLMPGHAQFMSLYSTV